MGVDMLLALDIGNTNFNCGVYREHDLVHSFRLTTHRERTAEELALAVAGGLGLGGLEARQIESMVVGSVVPPMRSAVDEMASRHLLVEPLWVEPGIRTGMPVLSENPQELGADRLANGVAAFERFGGPVIVVDFGTATSFDVISQNGEYLGGAIAPGVQISAEALVRTTARLPRVAVERPARAIGRNTVQCMQSGLYFGYRSLVEGLLAQIAGELDESASVVATGGLALGVVRDVEGIDHIEPHLTLEGLRILYERNLP